MQTYSEFQQKPFSEKIVLVKQQGSKLLKGWTLHSGSIYKLENFNYLIINKILDDDNEYTEVFDVGSVTASKWYLDRENKTLYLRTTGSDNPNGRFIFSTIDFFFANVPVTSSHDLQSGLQVFWEPLVSSTSSFGVELDNQQQLGFAVEGSGSVSYINDQDFWIQNYDKIFWENHNCYIYSWNRELPITEAKLIYQGRVDKKSFSESSIRFNLKDTLSQLRDRVELDNYTTLNNIRIKSDVLESKQRRLYGRVIGHRPVNLDVIEGVDELGNTLDGYPLTGTISVTNGSDQLIGVGTLFLKELSPDDVVILNGNEFTIQSVTSNTVATVSENYVGASISAETILLKPELAKNYTNRIWKVCNHEMRQPTFTVVEVLSSIKIILSGNTDLKVGDTLYFGTLGSGEQAVIDRISGNLIKLTTVLNNIPSVGSAVFRPCIDNVRINNTKLRLERDYFIDYQNVNAQITLNEDAEFNVTPTREMTGTVTFTTGLRTVAGVGTNFTSQLRPGYYLKVKGQFEFYEILSIEDDTNLTIRSNSAYTDTDFGQYKAVENFSDTDVLSCDVLGLTSDGTKDGTFLYKASQIVQDLLEYSGITNLNLASFNESSDISEHTLGLAIPETYNSKDAPIYRDLINKINLSVFGSLIQNANFELEYNILSPARDITTSNKFYEYDVLSFSVDTSGEKIVGSCIVEYNNKEYDTMAGNKSFRTKSSSSDISRFIMNNFRTKTISTLLVYESDAWVFSNRWRFLLELGSSEIKLTTKLQAARFEVNEKLDLRHMKLYERYGGLDARKVSAIQGVKKNASSVSLELEDLGSAFNRVATITPSGVNDFIDADLDERIYYGYITDSYGMIDNDSETFGINLIW